MEVELAAGIKTRQNQRGPNARSDWAVDAHGMAGPNPDCKGARAACKEAEALMDGLAARSLPADLGYDSDAVKAVFY